jgi:hypothetical protein
LAGVDENMDIDSMPDCRLKYKIIVKRARMGMGKFSDSQFTADDNSIGDELKSSTGHNYEWKRLGGE